MLHEPKTLEEAKRYRYGQWAGNPRGVAYAPDRCAAEVTGTRGRMVGSQCCNKNGHGPAGLYCKMHAKMVKKETATPSLEVVGTTLQVGSYGTPVREHEAGAPPVVSQRSSGKQPSTSVNNIYLVVRTDACDHDEYDSFVVVAKSATEARNTHPCGKGFPPRKQTPKDGWWAVNPVRVTLLGAAVAGQ